MSTKGIEMPSGLELYPHNEKAYRKLLDMLSETRRACIIHPTGTCKAFIAYRYAFDHPKERILWMSPSTYPASVLKTRKDDPLVSKMKVKEFLQAIPGIGGAKADKIMHDVDIPGNRRLGGLGIRQAEALLEYLS